MLPRVYQLSLLPSEHVQRFILWSLPRGDTWKIQGLLLLLEKEIILRFISPGVYLRRVEHFDDQNVTSSPRLGVHHCATAFLCHCPPCLQVCNGPQEPAPRPCRLPNHTVHELPSGKLIHFEIMYLSILYSISKNVRIEVTSSCCFFFPWEKVAACICSCAAMISGNDTCRDVSQILNCIAEIAMRSVEGEATEYVGTRPI